MPTRLVRAKRFAAWLALSCAALSCTSLAACTSVPLGGTGGGASFGRRDDRRFVGSFNEVRAVALSRRLVFAATPSGIGVYDRFFNAWLPPLTRDNGFTDDRVTFIAGDPVEDAVWYAVPGAVVVYRPTTEQLQRTIVPGVPDFIAFDRNGSGDALVRSGGTWTRVSRVGITTPLASAPPAASLVLPRTLQDVYQQFPALRSGTSFLLREQRADRALRNYPVISGSVSPERASEVWLGTGGDGLYRVDPSFQQATPLRFGPIETGIGALATTPDGVWMAGLGQSALRSGVSFATSDLQRWRWIDGTISVPLVGVRANALSLRASRAWIATERGVVLVRTDGSDDIVQWTTLDGLPDDRVYAIAARGDGAWAGTARGLVFVSDSAGAAGGARDPRTRGLGPRFLENTAVYALQAIGDTLWIGSSSGLVALAGRSGAVLRPVGADPALRRAIRALAWSDTMLIAATDDAVMRLSPRANAEPTRLIAADAAQVGAITRLAIDERSIVVAGTDGVMVIARDGGPTAVLRAPGELPAAALDVALSRDWLWIGTQAGLLRFRRSSGGGL